MTKADYKKIISPKWQFSIIITFILLGNSWQCTQPNTDWHLGLWNGVVAGYQVFTEFKSDQTYQSISAITPNQIQEGVYNFDGNEFSFSDVSITNWDMDFTFTDFQQVGSFFAQYYEEDQQMETSDASGRNPCGNGVFDLITDPFPARNEFSEKLELLEVPVHVEPAAHITEDVEGQLVVGEYKAFSSYFTQFGKANADGSADLIFYFPNFLFFGEENYELIDIRISLAPQQDPYGVSMHFVNAEAAAYLSSANITASGNNSLTTTFLPVINNITVDESQVPPEINFDSYSGATMYRGEMYFQDEFLQIYPDDLVEGTTPPLIAEDNRVDLVDGYPQGRDYSVRVEALNDQMEVIAIGYQRFTKQ